MLERVFEERTMPSEVRERLLALRKSHAVIVGSMNADYVISTKTLPGPGETVNGGPLNLHPGGKGANQAVAAALLGMDVTMLGAVGDDSNANFLLSKLDEAGVDTADIMQVDGATGTTIITVDGEGENTIVYSAGANSKVSSGYVQSHRDSITSAAALGLCLENPLSTVMTAAQIAHDAGVTVLLNDSPIVETMPHELIEATDVLLVNQHEMAGLMGISDEALLKLDWAEMTNQFADYGFDRVIVTFGPEGSIVIENGEWFAVPVVPVSQAIDSTGCGDAFMGTVLAGLASGYSLLRCAQMASYVSAYAVTKVGAQSSYGTAETIIDYFNGNQ